MLSIIWLCYNGLAFNSDKSKAIILGTTQRLRARPNTVAINVAGSLVQVSNKVSIRGVTFDSRISFDRRISALSKYCFYRIRALRRIRSGLVLDFAKSIACSRVCCRLDYADSILVEISGTNVARLRRIQKTLARVVSHRRGRISISQILRELHWLPVKWRTNYKIATLTYKILESDKPSYLRSRITDRIFRRTLRSTTDDRQLQPCMPYFSYEHWIASGTLCCSGNLKLPAVLC